MRVDKIHAQKIYKLGTFLNELRLGLGLSVREAAKRAQITPPHLSKIEKGNGIKSIGVVVLIHLAEAYRVPISTILKEAGFLENAEEAERLPDLATYLRNKYRFDPHAIRDMEMAKEIVDKKYDHRLSPPPPDFREAMSNFRSSFICRAIAKSLLSTPLETGRPEVPVALPSGGRLLKGSTANFFCSKK